jgi:hypothetical protein
MLFSATSLFVRAEHLPKGISISSAIPSMPINVKATTVTMGIVLQPRSLIRVNGRAKRYKVTHCFRWIPSRMLSVIVEGVSKD